MIRLQKKPANHLITAYNQIMEEIRNAYEDTDSHEMTLQKALDHAKQRAVNLGEVTAEEAHEIGEYIKRDINDAAEYMMDASAEFYDWLMLDIEIIERKVIDLFLSVADHTRIELEQFKQEATIAEQVPVYRSGEITGPGSLICECCGKVKHFIQSDKITPCKKCTHERFIRRQKKRR